jgi:hypothetical protein
VTLKMAEPKPLSRGELIAQVERLQAELAKNLADAAKAKADAEALKVQAPAAQ